MLLMAVPKFNSGAKIYSRNCVSWSSGVSLYSRLLYNSAQLLPVGWFSGKLGILELQGKLASKPPEKNLFVLTAYANRSTGCSKSLGHILTTNISKTINIKTHIVNSESF